jgi:hypothetical protein
MCNFKHGLKHKGSKRETINNIHIKNASMLCSKHGTKGWAHQQVTMINTKEKKCSNFLVWVLKLVAKP